MIAMIPSDIIVCQGLFNDLENQGSLMGPYGQRGYILNFST